MRDHAKSGALTEVTFFILLSLFTPNHGYGIMQFIGQQTEGRLVLGAGSLYGALTALQKKGWIAAADDGAGRKKKYLITALGAQVAAGELARLRGLVETATKLMEGKPE